MGNRKSVLRAQIFVLKIYCALNINSSLYTSPRKHRSPVAPCPGQEGDLLHWSSRWSFKKNYISTNLWKLLKNAWYLPSSMHSPTFLIFFLLWGPLLQMTEINTYPITQGSDSKRVIQISSSGRGLRVQNYFHNITKTCFAFFNGLTFAPCRA